MQDFTGLLSAIFSGSTLLVGVKLVFQAGKIVREIEEHERRINQLERIFNHGD